MRQPLQPVEFLGPLRGDEAGHDQLGRRVQTGELHEQAVHRANRRFGIAGDPEGARLIQVVDEGHAGHVAVLLNEGVEAYLKLGKHLAALRSLDRAPRRHGARTEPEVEERPVLGPPGPEQGPTIDGIGQHLGSGRRLPQASAALDHDLARQVDRQNGQAVLEIADRLGDRPLVPLAGHHEVADEHHWRHEREEQGGRTAEDDRHADAEQDRHDHCQPREGLVLLLNRHLRRSELLARIASLDARRSVEEDGPGLGREGSRLGLALHDIDAQVGVPDQEGLGLVDSKARDQPAIDDHAVG